MSSPSGTRHLRSLTGMRFLAAGGVVVAHIALSLGGRTAQRAAPHLAPLGWMGVSFFFVLSGFVLTWGARPADSARAFWSRRVARIYPAYLVTLLAAVLVSHLVEHGSTPAGPLAAAALLVQAWVPTSHWYFAGNAVAWSLSTEAFFYAVWPYLAPRILRLDLYALRQLACTVVAISFIAGAVGSFLVPSGSDIDFRTTQYLAGWFVYICPAARLPEFLLGVVLAAAIRQGWRPPMGVWQAWLLVAIVYAVTQALPGVMLDVVAIEVVPLALLLAASATRDAAGHPTVWAGPRWVLAGSASYCLYLVHELPLRVVQHHDYLPTGVASVRFAAIVGGSALVLAWLLHRFWEEPLERRLTGRVSLSDQIGVETG